MATTLDVSMALAEALWRAVADYLNAQPEDLSDELLTTAARVLNMTPEEARIEMAHRFPAWEDLDEGCRDAWAAWCVFTAASQLASAAKGIRDSHGISLN